MYRVNAQGMGLKAQGTGHGTRGTGHRAQSTGHSSSAHPVEVVMDGLKEDAAQHGASLAALVAMLVDEGGETGHGGCQVLIQVEVCRDLDSHLVSLHIIVIIIITTLSSS